MESIILLTDIDLFKEFNAILNTLEGNIKTSFQTDLFIIKNPKSHLTLSKLNPEDVFDDGLKHIYTINSELQFYYLSYNDIDFLKSIIVKIDHQKIWVDNDFDDITYTLNEFKNKILNNKDWDWRLSV
jgi:hypothetical protein